MLESFPKPKSQEQSQVNPNEIENFRFNDFNHSLNRLIGSLNRCELVETESYGKLRQNLISIEKLVSAKDIDWQKLNEVLISTTRTIEEIAVARGGNFRRDDVDNFRVIPRDLKNLAGEAKSLFRQIGNLNKPENEETKRLFGRLSTVAENKGYDFARMVNKLEDIYR